jgi:hypothetical protein
MTNSEVVSKIKKGDVIEYRFLENSNPKTAVVERKKPDNSGVYIKGITENTYFMINASEIVDVIEGQKA